MFGDNGSNDPHWQDQAWKDSVRVYLGCFYDEIPSAMQLVCRTLENLNDDIAKLIAIDDLPEPGEQSGDHRSSTSSKPESVPVKTKSKLEIKKQDIKSHFDKLHRYNLLYQSAVNHFLEDQKWKSKATTAIMKAGNRRYRPNKPSKAAPWTTVSQVIDNLHEATKRLSYALQKAASCSCHTFHLRLEMTSSFDLSIPLNGPNPCFNNRDPRYQTINFNLITLGCSSLQQPGDCRQMLLDDTARPSNRLSLRIELKPYATPKPKTIQTAPLVSASALPNPGKLSSCLKKPSTPGAVAQTINAQAATLPSSTPANSQSKFQKTVAFAHNSLMAVVPASDKKKRKQVGILENPRLKPIPNPVIDQTPTIETPLMPEEISDLCAWLRRLGFSSGTAGRASCCSGVLKADDDVQYLVHTEKSRDESWNDEHSAHNYASLLHYLSSDQDILSIAQRMELAHTLAISLLRLHSSSWIQRSWSSKDIILFLPPDATDAERRWSPYVAAAFKDLREIHEIAQAENEDVPGYKFSYVVSLGIIFLEIGLSRSLRDEYVDNTATGDPHFDAYMKACGEVKIHSVNMSMGPTYDRVVETCIKWMDADELDEKSVQQKFYEEVVLELEKCIKAANSSQERRRQKRQNRS
ncbi:hypothetical protein Dda_5955 [Drechslerella dactyloides]|uniref:DUF7580 domain-containing protein n=1 Tax=Drechslerella dactyloides TaxID=74499 RepID=A0AAD6NJH5_DREDA|nr:hypothetical protein Dda_5955 [Drechslerella dactyloides]